MRAHTILLLATTLASSVLAEPEADIESPVQVEVTEVDKEFDEGSPVQAAAELTVDVYEGPLECDDEDKIIPGKYVDVHYIGTINESSETGEKGKPFGDDNFYFTIGVGQGTMGFDESLLGLCQGARANIIVPPDKAFGKEGLGGDIPGGATLHLDVEIVSVSEPVGEINEDDVDADYEDSDPPNVFQFIDVNGDKLLDKEELVEYFKGKDRGEVSEKALWHHVYKDDKDGDGLISWDEFSGPKTDDDPIQKDEL